MDIDRDAAAQVDFGAVLGVRAVLVDIDVAGHAAVGNGRGAAAGRAVIGAALVILADRDQLTQPGGGVDQKDLVGVVVVDVEPPGVVEPDRAIGAGIGGRAEQGDRLGADAGIAAIGRDPEDPIGAAVDAVEVSVDRVIGEIDGVDVGVELPEARCPLRHRRSRCRAAERCCCRPCRPSPRFRGCRRHWCLS